MSEVGEAPKNETTAPTTEAPFRDVQFGKIYDQLEPNQKINIAAFGDITIEIDEQNLGLEKVSLKNLKKGWEREKETFSKRCLENGIDMDPFEVYKYYQIQRKVFQVLGQPISDATHRSNKLREMNDQVKLSEMKGFAMCSEYATLSTYLAQKIGEKAHLIIGSAVETEDVDRWREAHAYVWIDDKNMILDSVLAKGDYPALMKPTSQVSLSTLEEGKDVEAKRIGSAFTRFYGLEAGGFGVTMDQVPTPAK